VTRPLFTWLYACAAALAIAASCNLDVRFREPEPVRPLDRDLAAAKHCRETYGEAHLVYAANGEPVCIPKGYRK